MALDHDRQMYLILPGSFSFEKQPYRRVGRVRADQVQREPRQLGQGGHRLARPAARAGAEAAAAFDGPDAAAAVQRHQRHHLLHRVHLQRVGQQHGGPRLVDGRRRRPDGGHRGVHVPRRSGRPARAAAALGLLHGRLAGRSGRLLLLEERRRHAGRPAATGRQSRLASAGQSHPLHHRLLVRLRKRALPHHGRNLPHQIQASRQEQKKTQLGHQ